MRYIILLILFAAFGEVSFAQIKVGFDSTFLVGKEKQIYSYRHIEIDKHNNKFLVGTFKGTISVDTFTISTLNSITTSTGANAQGAFIVKYDSNNNLLWLKKLAEADTFFDANLYIDRNGNLIFSYGFLTKLYLDNDSITTQSGRTNINIIKYSNEGIKLSTKVIPGMASISGISFDENNNQYISGSFGEDTSQNYQLILGNDTLHAYKGDFFVAKINTSDNFIWAKSYGGHGTDGIRGINYYEGNLYLLGLMYAAGSSNNIGGLIFNFPLNYTSKCFIAKLDTIGNGIWVRRFGNNDLSGVSSLNPPSIHVQNNRVYFTGHASTNNQNVFLFDGGPTLIGNGNSTDYFIACYDTSGNFVWNTISNTFGSDYLSQLAVDSNSNVYGVGTMDLTSRFPSDTLHSNGFEDVMVCSYDSMGNFRWAANGGGSSSEVSGGIALDTHGKPYIVGGTTSTACYMGNDTLYPQAGQSTLFFASLDSIAFHAPDAVSHYTINANALKLFPNPASAEVHLELDIPNIRYQQSNINIQNVMGEILYSSNIKDQLPSVSANKLNMSIDLSSLPDGVYFITFKSNQHSITKKLIIQH